MTPKVKKRRVLIATNELGEIRAGGVATYIENLETMLEEEFEVGILFFWQISLVKIFEPSSFDEILSGPNTLIDFPLKWSTIPFTKGFSGPTTINFIFFSMQYFSSSEKLSGFKFTFSAI